MDLSIPMATVQTDGAEIAQQAKAYRKSGLLSEGFFSRIVTELLSAPGDSSSGSQGNEATWLMKGSPVSTQAVAVSAAGVAQAAPKASSPLKEEKELGREVFTPQQPVHSAQSVQKEGAAVATAEETPEFPGTVAKELVQPAIFSPQEGEFYVKATKQDDEGTAPVKKASPATAQAVVVSAAEAAPSSPKKSNTVPTGKETEEQTLNPQRAERSGDVSAVQQKSPVIAGAAETTRETPESIGTTTTERLVSPATVLPHQRDSFARAAKQGNEGAWLMKGSPVSGQAVAVSAAGVAQAVPKASSPLKEEKESGIEVFTPQQPVHSAQSVQKEGAAVATAEETPEFPGTVAKELVQPAIFSPQEGEFYTKATKQDDEGTAPVKKASPVTAQAVVVSAAEAAPSSPKKSNTVPTGKETEEQTLNPQRAERSGDVTAVRQESPVVIGAPESMEGAVQSDRITGVEVSNMTGKEFFQRIDTFQKQGDTLLKAALQADGGRAPMETTFSAPAAAPETPSHSQSPDPDIIPSAQAGRNQAGRSQQGDVVFQEVRLPGKANPAPGPETFELFVSHDRGEMTGKEAALAQESGSELKESADQVGADISVMRERMENSIPSSVETHHSAAASSAATGSSEVTHPSSSPLPSARPQAVPATIQVEGNRFVVTRLDGTSIEISLQPEGLGKLDIELMIDKGVVNAQIHASHAAAKELVEQNISQIVHTLTQEGITVGGFSVSLKQGREGEPEVMKRGGGWKKGVDRDDRVREIDRRSSRRGEISIFA